MSSYLYCYSSVGGTEANLLSVISPMALPVHSLVWQNIARNGYDWDKNVSALIKLFGEKELWVDNIFSILIKETIY